MKYHSILLLAVLSFFCLTPAHADTLDDAVKQMVAGAKNKAQPALPPISVFSHGILSHDNKLLLTGWNGGLLVPSDNPFSATKYHLIDFADPTGIHAPLFPAASGTVELLSVGAKTANGTLTAAECYGRLITNTGASGAIVLTLPTPVVGMHFRVFLTVAQDVDLNAANGTQILVLTNATGDAISSAAGIGNSIELVAVSATTWAAFAVSGTWTDVN